MAGKQTKATASFIVASIGQGREFERLPEMIENG
jgi:hypothetical protein